MNQTVIFDPALLRRHDVNAPRYTSYPTVLQFSESFGEAEYCAAARASNDDPIPKPLSLYVHIPFCASPCFFCACNRVITRDSTQATLYLDRLHREIELQAALFDRDRVVEQLHFGGGTPNFLRADALAELMHCMGTYFNLTSMSAREYSIEIDPRSIKPEDVQALADIGFNRISLGVQDFDTRVQQAVNRMQPVDETLAIISAARATNLRSINLDLIYGLPFQSLAGFSRTLDIVIAARPDRLAVYGYAHLPNVFKAQRQIDELALPPADVRLELLGLAIAKLSDAGYIHIGMDHFAVPEDELVLAQQDGSLHRNFQGYSTRSELDMIGLGMSAIGRIGDTLSQNTRDLEHYHAALDAGQLAITRGRALTTDDRLRREIIQQVLCKGRVDFAAIENRWAIEFRHYFRASWPRLEQLARDGLMTLDDRGLAVTPAGRLLLRVIAMCFDAYASQVVDASKRFYRAI